jgi:hypothetical protein
MEKNKGSIREVTESNKKQEEDPEPEFEILECETGRRSRLFHTLKTGFVQFKPIHCYDRCIKETIADKKWDEQLKTKNIRDFKKIGKINEAKTPCEAFTKCGKHCCRHYHNMSCITWIIEVLSVFSYVIDVPLDIAVIMYGKFDSRFAHDAMAYVMILPFIVMLIFICCKGKTKRPCRPSFFAEYVMCCISHNQIDSIGEESTSQDLRNKLFWLLIEDLP